MNFLLFSIFGLMLVDVEVELKVLLVRQFDASLGVQKVVVYFGNALDEDVFEAVEIYLEVITWTRLQLDICVLFSELFDRTLSLLLFSLRGEQVFACAAGQQDAL
jgi:hypothetical protein